MATAGTTRRTTRPGSSQGRPWTAAGARLKRRTWPICATVVFFCLAMAYFFRWGPTVEHIPYWNAPGDLWETYAAANSAVHGHFGADIRSRQLFLRVSRNPRRPCTGGGSHERSRYERRRVPESHHRVSPGVLVARPIRGAHLRVRSVRLRRARRAARSRVAPTRNPRAWPRELCCSTSRCYGDTPKLQ